MKPLLARRLLLIVLLIIAAAPASSGAELRTALVIGNSAYSTGPLKNPVNDATDMAAALQKAGSTVTLKKNAKLREMEEAIEGFGNSLKRGGVGLFYFAGHGVQVNGVNYLLPVGARINKESDVKYEAVDANRILDEMAGANNGLNIVMLDACRDNPFARSFRSASRGLAIVSSAPTGTFISYSTGPGQVARDGEGRNSPYTGALLQHMKEPGIPITDMFMKVRQKLQKETGQVPWELSSLVGTFSFVPGRGSRADVVAGRTAADDELQAERAKLEADRAQLQKEKELLAQRRALEEEKRKLEEERKQLAVIRQPAMTEPKEVRRDRRFIAYDNGTVLDTRTNLMWASKDNGHNIYWADAKKYCEYYGGGGYTDWRMPTQNELAGLYDESITNQIHPPSNICAGKYHFTEMIRLTCCCPWALETRGSEAAMFDYYSGGSFWQPQSIGLISRALPVRSATSALVEETVRFIANTNGTVTDKKTGLMWAAEDNGSDIGWEEAKSYCHRFRAGGYTDWRMPTQDELNSLYDAGKSRPAACFPSYSIHASTDLIRLTCTWYHASETRGSEKAYFNFGLGNKNFSNSSGITTERVLPVRSAR
ncbi:MAG: DUF1566 domain-containing protein [Syntrophales bacterium]|jgi:uncharacterized caspase-like protein|nr:DUF1566 domain-containing protein [Syntrophales bacterium]